MSNITNSPLPESASSSRLNIWGGDNHQYAELQKKTQKPFSFKLVEDISAKEFFVFQKNRLKKIKAEFNCIVQRIVNHGIETEQGSLAQKEIEVAVLGLAAKLQANQFHQRLKGAAIRLILRVFHPDHMELAQPRGIRLNRFHGLKSLIDNPQVKDRLIDSETWNGVVSVLIDKFADLSENKKHDVGVAILRTFTHAIGPRNSTPKPIEIIKKVSVFLCGDLFFYTVRHARDSLFPEYSIKTSLLSPLTMHNWLENYQAMFRDKSIESDIVGALTWAILPVSFPSFYEGQFGYGENNPGLSRESAQLANRKILALQSAILTIRTKLTPPPHATRMQDSAGSAECG